MKRYRWLLVVFMLLVGTSSYAISFAERYKCDTLFHTGSGQQLQMYHDEIIKQFRQIKRDKSNREAIAHLYGLLCECKMAQGQYKVALEYADHSKKLFEEILSAPGGDNNLKAPYDYGLVCHYIACLNYLLMSSNKMRIDYNLQSANIFADWIQRVLATKDNVFIGQQKINFKYVVIPMGVGSILLDMSGHNYSNAVSSGEELLEKIKKSYPGTGTRRYEYSEALILLAEVYISAQDYDQALRYTREALMTIERSWGRNNATYAHALYMTASIYHHLNDRRSCEDYLFRSIDLYEKTGHIMHAEYANALELLGHLYSEVLIINEARKKYDKALEIIKKSCGDKCFHVYLNRYYAANLLMQENRYQEAAQQAWGILQNKTFHENISGDHCISAMTLYMEASLISGHYQDIIDNAADCEDVLKTLNDVGQSEANRLYVAIGKGYQAAQRYTEACIPFQTALDYFREMARRNFAFLSEEQRNNFWNRDKMRFEAILLQNQYTKDDAKGSIGQLLYNASLLQKGLLLNTSVNMARIIENKGTESLKRDMHRLRLMMQSDLKTPEMRQACRQLEQQVQNDARKYGDFMDFANYTWQDVRNSMNSHDVAIEFVCSTYDKDVHVSAELLSSSQKAPKHIYLFSYRKTDNLTFEQIAARYVQVIRQKILPLLKPDDHVYFAPAGEMHQLPIEYLELLNGKRMNEVYQMHRLSSTRQLITMRNQRSTQKKMALFGGLNYNSSLDDMELQAMIAKEQSRSKNRNSHSTMWSYLPGTLKEVSDIASIMKSASYKVSTFTQEEGVEEQFKALSESHTGIIHVATHGFYEAVKGKGVEYAGLIFSGANNFWAYSSASQQDIDDGVLTTTEIANMNLIGTDLVVLSACQTGLGLVSGEGIFGLQRAFKKAGAQSILMSLWEVDDEATQVLMTAFYRYLKAGNSKREALMMAQKQVWQEQFVRNGQTVSGSDFHYWGGFILID